MLHRATLILRGSWITDLTRSDSPSGAIASHRRHPLPQHLCAPNPPRPLGETPPDPPNRLSLCEGGRRPCPLPHGGTRFALGEQHPFPKGSQSPGGFGERTLRPAARSVPGCADAPRKRRLCPPPPALCRAVLRAMIAHGRKGRATRSLLGSFPACRAHSPLPSEERRYRNKAIILLPSQTGRKLI